MSAILEKFFIQFEGDAGSIRRGLAQAESQSDHLKRSLSSVDMLANKVGHSFKETLMGFGKGFLGFFALEKIGESIHSVAEYADEIGKLSKVTGVSTENLSAWGQAVKQDGGSMQEFEGTVSRMSAQFADFATKGHSRAAPFFKELGIRMVDAKGKARSFIDVLPELADKFSKMGKGEALGVGQRLGLDQGTINLLSKGRKEVEKAIERQKELGVITGNQAEVAEDFNDRLDDFGIIIKKVFLEISEVVLPILTTFLKGVVWLNKLIREHAALAVGFLIPVLSLLAGVVLVRLAKSIGAVGKALKVASASPIVLIIAAFLALAAVIGLVIEDIYGFFHGQKSLIGDLMKKYPKFAAVLRAIGTVFKELWAGWAQVFSFLWSSLLKISNVVNHPIQAFKNLINVIKQGWDWFASEFPRVAAIIKNVFLSIANVISFVWNTIKSSIDFVIDGILGGIKSVEKAYDKVKGFFKGDGKVDITATNQSIAQVQSVPFSSLGKTLANSTSIMKNSNVNIAKVEVQTQATDADGISKSIADSLNAQMRQSVNRFDDGIAA